MKISTYQSIIIHEKKKDVNVKGNHKKTHLHDLAKYACVRFWPNCGDVFCDFLLHLRVITHEMSDQPQSGINLHNHLPFSNILSNCILPGCGVVYLGTIWYDVSLFLKGTGCYHYHDTHFFFNFGIVLFLRNKITSIQ